MIGPDPRVPGVLHACGHEGAGIGLAAATGLLVARHLDGADVEGVRREAFLPDRFLVGGTGETAGAGDTVDTGGAVGAVGAVAS